MSRFVLLGVLASLAVPAHAMTLTMPYEAVSRAEFVAGLVAVGLTKVSETELETPAGYRLNLGSASDFRVVQAWLDHHAFNGTFCEDNQAYDITTFEDPSDMAFERYSALAVDDDFRTTLALERTDALGIHITRDVPEEAQSPFKVRCPAP